MSSQTAKKTQQTATLPLSYPCEELTLHVPPLEEVAQVLQNGLAKHFAQVTVNVTQCPDLTAKPFNLIRPGLSGGQQVLLDVGGPAYIIPTAKLEHYYDLQIIAEQLHLEDHAVIGAGAGPYRQLGHNSELVVNVSTAAKKNNSVGCCESGSRYCLVINSKTDAIVSEKNLALGAGTDTPMHVIAENSKLSTAEFAVLGNFYASRGERGEVICIKAKKQIGNVADFTECVRAALAERYGSEPVGLGGTFAVKRGRVRVHVMSDFSSAPIRTEDELNQWLKFYSLEAPLSFHGEIVSYDPGYDLRTKHAHGYGPSGGGHYHNHESPDVIEYEAYYNVATRLYRVDRPDEESVAAARIGHD